MFSSQFEKKQGKDRLPNGRAGLWRLALDLFLFCGIMGLAVVLSMALFQVDEDNHQCAMAIFILSVVLIARACNGYFWGIAASVLGTFCVNYMFTWPFWAFNVSYPGYMLTFVVMLAVSVIVSAMTTRIKQQEQLRFEAERQKLRANLLRAIAHDIRTPLASILGASSAIMEESMTREDELTLLLSIQKDAQWLTRVTENLLFVSRLAADGIPLKKELEVLEEIAGSAVLKYKRQSGALPVKTQMPEEILTVPMDPILIQQVLLNLFDNVSSHGRGATQIWLSAALVQGSVWVSVEDDGCGFSETDLSRIIERSSRSHCTQEKEDGKRRMGIGLSVCQSIIVSHGGTMEAGRSRYGGALVRFSLPMA